MLARATRLGFLLVICLLMAHLGLAERTAPFHATSDPPASRSQPGLPDTTWAAQWSSHQRLQAPPETSRIPAGGTGRYETIAEQDEPEQPLDDRGVDSGIAVLASRQYTLTVSSRPVSDEQDAIPESHVPLPGQATVRPPDEPVEQTAPTHDDEPLPVLRSNLQDEMRALKLHEAGKHFEMPEWSISYQEGKALLVDQSQQLMYVFEDGKMMRVMPVSTGRPAWDSFTPSFRGNVGRRLGTVWVYGQSVDHAWFLFEATDAILMHSAPYTLVNGVKVYSDLDALGARPSSQGCIRLHPDDAAWLTAWNPAGVPIEITRWPGEIDWTTGRSHP